MSVYRILKNSFIGATVAAGLVITPAPHSGRQTLTSDQSSATTGTSAPRAADSPESNQPQANKEPLLRPEEVPSFAADKIPPDLQRYRLVDTLLATFKSIDPVTRVALRRRGIIAHMALESGDPNGANSRIDGHYSAQDLRRGKHPEAESIIAQMNEQTDNCTEAQNGQATTQKTQAKDAKAVVVASNLAKTKALPVHPAAPMKPDA